MLPKIGMAWQPASMARAAWADIAAWRREGWQPDLIDAHYLYPDGVAACMLARRLGVPFVMTARGSDVNLIARLPGPGRRIAQAAAHAAAVIAVADPLRDGLLALGVDATKLHVLRNGVDTDVFRPEDRAAARARAALPAGVPLLAVVGNLLPEKGQALAIEALALLPGVHLVIVGEGPARPQWLALAQRLGVQHRMHWRASMPQAQLRDVYAAADALLLTSSREGWPNVVLESMACGTPVVAMDVGAVRQMIVGPEFGRIVTERSAAALAAAAAAQLAQPASRQALQQHAAAHDWASIARAQWDLFTRAVASA
jgi:glycosyltransferase involved in cell wall biosynthesis